MGRETQRQCGPTRIPPTPGGQALSAGQGPARSRAVVGSCSRFRLAVAAGAEARRRARVTSQTPSRPGPPALPCPAGPVSTEVVKRFPRGRVRHRGVDVSARGRGDPADLRGQLSPGPCVAAGAEADREPPEAQAPCPRARQGRPPALAHASLATTKKARDSVTLIVWWYGSGTTPSTVDWPIMSRTPWRSCTKLWASRWPANVLSSAPAVILPVCQAQTARSFFSYAKSNNRYEQCEGSVPLPGTFAQDEEVTVSTMAQKVRAPPPCTDSFPGCWRRTSGRYPSVRQEVCENLFIA
jgi:hypothetical protein